MPKQRPDLTAITIRFDAKDIARIDAHVKRLRAKTPSGVQVSRTDAMRNLLEAALAAAK